MSYRSLIDSGCSNHLTHKFSAFIIYKPLNGKSIEVFDGQLIRIYGIGTIQLEACKHVLKIQDVYYVPKASHNLPSVGQLISKGLNITFNGASYSIYLSSRKLLLKVKMESRIFPITFLTDGNLTDTCFAAKDEASLLHKQFGHVNSSSLTPASKSNLVERIPKLEQDHRICEIW